MRAPIRIELTAAQHDQLTSVVAGADPVWLVDLDAVTVRSAEEWRRGDPPQLLGQRIAVVVGPGPAAAALGASVGALVGDRQVVWLDPGRDGHVFGTGRHPTTRLAVELLEQFVRPRDEVADVGTGSGVLAIAALRLGAARAVAFDLDPEAVQVARFNATANGLSAQMTVRVGPLRAPSKTFDLVVANLITGTVLDLLADLARVTRPSGTIIASAIVRTRLAEVARAAEKVGWVVVGSRGSATWAALALQPAARRRDL